MLAVDVVDVDREAVWILEEVVGCRANIDTKCGGIKGRAICCTAEASVLEGLVGDVEEELLLHVVTSMHMLSRLPTPKYSSSRGGMSSRRFPWRVVHEGRAHIRGDCEHHDKVDRVELAQDMWVRRDSRGVKGLGLREG